MPGFVKTALIALISICVTVVVMLAVWNRIDNRPLLPDKPPDTIDQNAAIDDTTEEKMKAPNGGSGLSLEYAKEVSIDLSSANATLYFKNSGKSLQNAVVALVIQDTVILQSDLLPPGSTLTTIPLPTDGVPLQSGTYSGVFIVQFFDENGDAAHVNSCIEGITIFVK
ncbi:MAG: hypothetical protein IKV99_07515 [Oscillospiraceae bacterium]|nr:hypothetical protein [Oscillospiraceae bacterium]